MNYSFKTWITIIFSSAILTSTHSTIANAEDDLIDLQVESEIVTADAAFDVDMAQKSKDVLHEKRNTRKSELPRLREEIRQAFIAQKWARQEITANEKATVRLENERVAAQSELNKATIQTQKTERLLKSAQAHFDRKQKMRDAVIEKREKAVARMIQRTDASDAMVARVEQAERDLKAAEAQYQKTVQLERDQKKALAKKHALLKKRISDANLKTNRVKSMIKKVEIGRAG